MPKMKTKKALSKRIRVSKNGKVKMAHAFRSHRAHGKTTKQKRQSKKSTNMHPSDVKRISILLQGRRK
jgi:large subunit ribosomal protein L35